MSFLKDTPRGQVPPHESLAGTTAHTTRHRHSHRLTIQTRPLSPRPRRCATRHMGLIRHPHATATGPRCCAQSHAMYKHAQSHVHECSARGEPNAHSACRQAWRPAHPAPPPHTPCALHVGSHTPHALEAPALLGSVPSCVYLRRGTQISSHPCTHVMWSHMPPSRMPVPW